MFATIALPERLTPEQHLAQRIRLARTTAGMSQRQLGIKIGMTRQGIGYIESTGNVSGVTLSAIADATEQPWEFFKI